MTVESLWLNVLCAILGFVIGYAAHWWDSHP